MNLFELFVKIGVDDQASGKLSKLSSSLGKGLATAAKIGTAAVGAAATGITALTKAAVNNYAEYEQLVGGVETLFKNSSDTVMGYAENAYKTAGLSANEYMETVTSFSASLLQSLGGDTAAAAEYADLAITDMADNANKMGSSIDTIQTAYAGFAKQNYTLLDNLKLGYGGTKEEMQRLIADAAELSDTVDAQSLSFQNIVEAIHVVQTEMGITGTTALEAGRTISGSVGAMKSAWTNLVTGFADGSADIGGLIDNLVTTIVGDGTENNLGVIGNVLPAIETALGGIAKLIEGAAPKIIEILPGLVERIVPSVISAATGMVNAVIAVLPDLLNTVVDAIIDNAPALIDSAIVLIGELSNGILSQLPQIVALGLDLLVSLATGISQSLPTLIPTIIDVILQIVETLTNPTTLSNLLKAALAIVVELANGLMNNIDELIDAVFTLIDGIVDFIVNPSNLAMLISAAVEIVLALGVGIVKAIPQLLVSVGSLIGSIFTTFTETDWGTIGSDLVEGFKAGIRNAWTGLKTWFEGLFGDLIGVAKRILGIASPSKVFKSLGAFSAEGFGIGFDKEFSGVKSDIEDAMRFDGASIGVTHSVSGAGRRGVANGAGAMNVNITINAAEYGSVNAIADAVVRKIDIMTRRKAAVYG